MRLPVLAVHRRVRRFRRGLAEGSAGSTTRVSAARVGVLVAQQPVGSDIWVALAWCLGVLVVTYVVATALYRRRIG